MSLLSRLIVCVVGVALTVASVTVTVTAAAARTTPPLTWGVTGHYMTAAIAQGLLSTEASNGLTNLLPESDGQMGQVASWADQVARSKFPWSPPLHFINTPDWMCNYDRKRDCQDERGHPGVCVDQAIQNFSTQLVKNDAPLSLNVAVKFVIHFIGDIHQPLHVGFTSDLGGNTIVGTFEGKSGCKLHGIWDYNIIEKRQSSDFGNNNATYLHYFMNRLSTGDWNTQIPAWQSCPSDDPSPINACSQTWAKESIELACSHAYVDQNGNKIESGFDLEDAYYQFALPVVEMQLARGGVRLANVINAIFALPHMKKYTVDPSEFARNQKEQDKEYISLW